MLKSREKTAVNHGITIATIMLGRANNEDEALMFTKANLIAKEFWASEGSEDLVDRMLDKDEETDAKKETA